MNITTKYGTGSMVIAKLDGMYTRARITALYIYVPPVEQDTLQAPIIRYEMFANDRKTSHREEEVDHFFRLYKEHDALVEDPKLTGAKRERLVLWNMGAADNKPKKAKEPNEDGERDDTTD